MTRRRRRHTRAACALLCATLAAPAAVSAAAPAAASAASGGAAPSTGAAPAPAVENANVPVTTSGGGVTLQTMSSAMVRSGLAFTGTAGRDLAGRTIEIERVGDRAGGGWTEAAAATVAADGSFTAVWRVDQVGQLAIRAVVADPGTAAQATAATPPITVTAYQPSVATQYGPGLYGNRTACGEKLRPQTIGVANLKLPCGALVSVLYRGRALAVPVIDRGPYTKGVGWDLTEATGRALGIPGTARVGTTRLPASATTASSRVRR